MDKRDKIALCSLLTRASAIMVVWMFLIILCGCATVYTDKTMQPLAATAGDLARAVMRFAKNNPDTAASLNDRELVRRATAYDPKLLEPYDGLVVRGTVDGVILVCTADGRRGLIEDAECTDKVDKLLWHDKNAPCTFTLKPQTLCPKHETARRIPASRL